jgi:hypothetical protein
MITTLQRFPERLCVAFIILILVCLAMLFTSRAQGQGNTVHPQALLVQSTTPASVDPHRPWFTTRDLAERYNVEPAQVRQWIAQGRIIPEPKLSRANQYVIAPNYRLNPR